MDTKYIAAPTSEVHYNEVTAGAAYSTYQSNATGPLQQQQHQQQYVNLSIPDTLYRPASTSTLDTVYKPELEKSNVPGESVRSTRTNTTVALPFLRKRVSRKAFFIIIGIIVAIVIILIVVGIAVGVTKANSKRSNGLKKGNKAFGLGAGGSSSLSVESNQDTQEDSDDSSSSSSSATSDSDNTDFSGSTDSSGTESSSSSSSSSSTSSDPCVQLQNVGAGIDAISNCLSQKHQTTMNIIDNFGTATGSWSIIKRK